MTIKCSAVSTRKPRWLLYRLVAYPACQEQCAGSRVVLGHQYRGRHIQGVSVQGLTQLCYRVHAQLTMAVPDETQVKTFRLS